MRSSNLCCNALCITILLLFTCIRIYAQTPSKITVVGRVTDSIGNVIPGASVVVENKRNIGASTNENGQFILDVSPGTRLVITAIGFQSNSVLIKSADTKISVVLKEKNSKLEEVVITAYGKKQRKEAVVGSVTSVQPENLKIPSSNLTTALAGQVAGIVAYQRSGQPGQDNATFFIRGVTTFGYKQDPLILVDNVELTSNDLARLQVDDIASFSILKDASATSLYGARGANGVILVTTKEGKVGKAKVNARIENGISQPTQRLQIADPITYMKLYNEAITTRNPLQAPLFSQNKILNTEQTLKNAPGSNPYVYPAVDWMKLMFKDRTTTQRANLNVSGGGGVARYYVAGSYNLDNGILKENKANSFNNNVKFQNYQLRSNVNIDVTTTTELIVRLSGNFNDYNGPITNDASFATDLYSQAMHTSPVLFPAMYAPDEANIYTKHILFGNSNEGGSAIGVGYTNPLANMLKGYKRFSESRLSAQFEVNQKLSFVVPGLSFRGLFSTNRYAYFDNQMAYQPFFYNIGTYDQLTDKYTLKWLNPQTTGGGVATEYLVYYPGYKNMNTFLYLQGVLEYSGDFGKHNVSSSLVATRQQTLYANALDPNTQQPSLQYSLPYRNLGLAGRATYSYNRRYFLEFSFGYNGSERFSANHRYGFFPTVGASWVISNESFWKGMTGLVDRLKIRGSYGLAGNDAIGSQRFFYMSDVNLNAGYPTYFGTNNGYIRNGVYINNYANPDVTWETSKQTNLGVEVTLFKNLNIIAEIYKQHRENILMNRASIPSTMGLEAGIAANLGSASSKGLDLEMNYKQNFGEHLWISARGNLTVTENKYEHYEEPVYAEAWRYRAGKPINQNFGYIAERLFVDDKEAAVSPRQIFSNNGIAPMGGDIKYRDINKDGQITEADKVPIGLPTTPQIVYGFGFSAGYRNFDLSAFFQGLARTTLFIDPRYVSPFVIPPYGSNINGQSQLMKAWADDHWSEENQNLYAQYPRLGTSATLIDNNLQTSTWWMRDGSFIRLKSLEFGYTLPKSLLKRASVSNCRIYFSGLNLFTWSRFKLWDPELGGNGFAYPVQKVFNAGLNVNF
ncbi:TonB-linked outer membrane protein, SusC/RagA family [Chitinophaga sp. CF118]|uniref:SusC/RagA family TonB-linked outer membrane protein n=1 Tax=Chitinophaga sp. CF118 TaxID=1884367 RepID=UPI0008E279D1|nr:TonB-dependent receptor [Chitinophaga sp. CF118]SFE43111.1 TonB-linked outer membrane protein, SusC/RagA family [Chitinophaga sp. CF118]